MVGDSEILRLAWWNVDSFAKYDPQRTFRDRWPESEAEYRGKCSRVDAVLKGLFEQTGTPDVLALCEITRSAAEDLRDRVLSGYHVMSLDLFPNDPGFEVALIYRPLAQFEEVQPIVVPQMPRGTRPMAVLDFTQGDHQLRIIAAHWTARFGDAQVRRQERIAVYLRSQMFDFLTEPSDLARHVIVMGDLNTEPYEVAEHYLDATRCRDRARGRRHYIDDDEKRVRMYNCAWRMLGESQPHSPPAEVPSVAGTFYWREKNSWHTYDQVLVSGSLLTHETPYLLEDRVGTYVNRVSLDDDGRPEPFSWNGDRARGASEHLPVFASLRLTEVPND